MTNEKTYTNKDTNNKDTNINNKDINNKDIKITERQYLYVTILSMYLDIWQCGSSLAAYRFVLALLGYHVSYSNKHIGQ